MRVEDAQGGEGVVLRQSLERACRGVKQILVLVLAKLFEALLAWSKKKKRHCWLLFIVRLSICLQVFDSASRRCPRWRRRRSASGQGSASRRQSCRSLEGGSQANLLFSQCCLIHYWLSERLGVNKKGTILCLYVEVLVLKSVGATANSVLVQYPIYLWLGCGSSVMDFYLILFLLSKTFRSLKGGTKCCSVCMVSCVAYSFLIWCADCLCNCFSLEQMVVLFFQFVTCRYFLWMCQNWRIYIEFGYVCVLKTEDEKYYLFMPWIY